MIGFLLDANSVTCSHIGRPRRGVWKRLPANKDREESSTHESPATLRFTATDVFQA